MHLEGTWLVTLSACDTGRGEARSGEGILGLRRGFVEAGTQNLLVTLWPIRDVATAEIMRDFYSAALHDNNAPRALADVQCRWLKKLRDSGTTPGGGIPKPRITQAVNVAGAFIMTFQGKP